MDVQCSVAQESLSTITITFCLNSESSSLANKRKTLPGGIDIDALDLEVEDNSVIIHLVLSNSKRTVQVLRARGKLLLNTL